jgi:hypothetical protein
MTLQGAEQTPVFTIQRMHTTEELEGNFDTRIVIPLAKASAIDKVGKDRNFISFYDFKSQVEGVGINFNNSWVWELDRGWGFGANPIPAWFTTTHNFFDNPFQISTVRDIRLHGLSLGLGELTVAVSADYLSNDFPNGNIYGQMPTNTAPQDISLPRAGGDDSWQHRAGDLQPQTNIAAVGKTGRSFSFQFATKYQQNSQGKYPTGTPYPPIVAQQLLFQISNGKADIK